MIFIDLFSSSDLTKNEIIAKMSTPAKTVIPSRAAWVAIVEDAAAIIFWQSLNIVKIPAPIMQELNTVLASPIRMYLPCRKVNFLFRRKKQEAAAIK